jgi:hypothetical protein
VARGQGFNEGELAGVAEVFRIDHIERCSGINTKTKLQTNTSAPKIADWEVSNGVRSQWSDDQSPIIIDDGSGQAAPLSRGARDFIFKNAQLTHHQFIDL